MWSPKLRRAARRSRRRQRLHQNLNPVTIGPSSCNKRAIKNMKRESFTFPVIVCLAAVLLFTGQLAAQSRKDRAQAKALKEQGDKAYRQKEYRTAADKYGEALLLVPTDPEAHYRKGFAHFDLK